jgi:tetratricopeptide (TPR) repeat protein
VLEKQADSSLDNATRIQVLNKLGTIYGDRLGNDEGAVNAWRQLLALDPNDRKAQEALKKKYLALGRWDDLEVFYAESGKWDEFIRVLEQQEAKETEPAAKLGMLFKIAELWADKKQKADRAARAYEKVLELDPSNLRAADSLVPIYQQAGNAKQLAAAIEVKLAHEDDGAGKVALLREVAGLYEGRVKEPQRAFERYAAAFAIEPTDERSAEDMERAAKATGDWPAVVVAYEKAIDDDRRLGHRPRELRLRLGRVLEAEVKDVDRAHRDLPRGARGRRRERGRARRARAALPRHTSKFSELLGIYEKKRELAASKATSLRRSPTRSRSSTRWSSRRRPRDRHVPTRPRRRAYRRACARRARRALRDGSSAGSRTRTCSVAASSSTCPRASSSTSSTASVKRSSSTSATRRALENYREILFLAARPTTARGSRSRICSRTRASAPTPPRSSRRSTRSAATHRSSSSRSRS